MPVIQVRNCPGPVLLNLADGKTEKKREEDELSVDTKEG
jgi:hypothetical protein